MQLDEFTKILEIVNSLAFSSDENSRRRAAFSLERLSQTSSDERLKAIGKIGSLATLIDKIGIDISMPLSPITKLLGNLLSASDDEMMNSLLDLGILKKVNYLMKHCKENQMQEIAWMLSNITAGTLDQINFMLKHEDIV